MTRQWAEYVLNNDWETDVAGRDHSVPQPKIEVEQDRSNIRLRNQDHINIVDGGDNTFEPMGVGYTHRRSDLTVDVVVRVSRSPPDPPNVERPGLVRMQGARDENNDAESYGGIKGEIQRILDLYRKGDKEFDLIETSVWRDDIASTGVNHFTGRWVVEFSQRAQEISPPQP